jgi:hypothetical protein
VAAVDVKIGAPANDDGTVESADLSPPHAAITGSATSNKVSPQRRIGRRGRFISAL